MSALSYRLKNGVEVERIGDGGAIIFPDGGIGTLNRTAVDIVEMIARGFEDSRIVEELGLSYGEGKSVLASDFEEICTELERLDAVECVL